MTMVDEGVATLELRAVSMSIARRQAEAADLFADLFAHLGDAAPDTGFIQLQETFNLEDRLAASRFTYEVPASRTPTNPTDEK